MVVRKMSKESRETGIQVRYLSCLLVQRNNLIIGIRYKINMFAKDPSGEIRLEGFNDLGLSLFGGTTASEMFELQVTLVLLATSYSTVSTLNIPIL